MKIIKIYRGDILNDIRYFKKGDKNIYINIGQLKG